MCPPDDVSAAATEATNAPATLETVPSITTAEATISPIAEPPHYSIIETWVNDLIGNIPHLRETEAFNILRNAIEELKSKL